MNEIVLQEKRLLYQQILHIWEQFCTFHKDLFDLTCEEYLILLDSNIEKLETKLPIKEEIIAKIGELEKERSELIEKINNKGIFPHIINRSSELLASFEDIDSARPVPALKNLNALLIDIIHQLQEQNRKNQLFLNKAIISLKEVKKGFSGVKTYTTYGADGMTRSASK